MKPKPSIKGPLRPISSYPREAPPSLPPRNSGLRPQTSPIIGFTSQIIRTSKWYKEIAQTGLRAVEINRRHSKLHFNLYFLDKVRKYLDGYEISLHSATNGLFQDLEAFTAAEMAIIKAEVETARFLGAGEIVFHLNDGWSKGGGHDRLREIIDFSHDRGIELLYESNSGFRAGATLEVLDWFPDIGYVLDLGHLNLAIEKNVLGCPIDEFMDRIAPRTVYIHASNNDGLIDEHKGMDQGSLDWTWILDRLDLNRIKKIIIEVRSFEYLAETKIALAEYLDSRTERVRDPLDSINVVPRTKAVDQGRER